MQILFYNLVLIFILLHNSLFAGFAAGTLVKTPKGYQAIESIHVGDLVYAVTKQRTFTISTVTHTTSYALPTAIKIVTQNDIIIAAPKQKFYLPHEQKWISAQKIQLNHHLGTGQKTCTQEFTIYPQTKVTDFFDIRLDDVHTFCVSIDDLIVHNFPLCFIGFTIAWGAGQIVLDGIYCGICIAGWWLGTKLLKGHNSSGNNKFKITPFISTGSPDPDNDWFEKLKKSGGRKAFHKHFKKFYKDSKTDIWWSKDIDNHGGSIYKAFKEGARGLDWLFDADKLGRQILDKHKGPTGIFIPYKDLIFY